MQSRIWIPALLLGGCSHCNQQPRMPKKPSGKPPR